VGAAPPSGAYDWSGHDVHYRGLMHTIAGMPSPLIVRTRAQPDKRVGHDAGNFVQKMN
jgi:hypothetical protein